MEEIQKYLKYFVETTEAVVVEELFKYMKDRDYDTDSIKFDLQEHESYINGDKFGEEIPKLMQDFIKAQSG